MKFPAACLLLIVVKAKPGSELLLLERFIDRFRAQRDVIDALLVAFGGIRWRGFPLAGTAEFERGFFCLYPIGYSCAPAQRELPAP
jgi:hypothetical protein